jgi:hypothetical protein
MEINGRAARVFRFVALRASARASALLGMT